MSDRHASFVTGQDFWPSIPTIALTREMFCTNNVISHIDRDIFIFYFIWPLRNQESATEISESLFPESPGPRGDQLYIFLVLEKPELPEETCPDKGRTCKFTQRGFNQCGIESVNL